MNWNRYILFAVAAASVEHSAAWAPTAAFSTASSRHASSTSLWSLPSEQHNNDEASTSSRRQWLTNIAAGAVATASAVGGWPVLPADAAATLVSATSICDPTVSVWSRDGRIVYLLGTAHVSASSAQLAGKLVQDIHPNAVFVELDVKRVQGSGILAKRVDTEDVEGQQPKSQIIIPNLIQLNQQQRALAAANTEGGDLAADMPVEQPPVVTQPKQKANPLMRAATAAVGNSIKGMYKKLDTAGFNAGEEFVVTMKEAQNIGAAIILGDRDVEVTLRRVTEGLAQTDFNALLSPDSELEKSMAELVPSKMVRDGANGDFDDPNYRSEFSDFVEVIKTKENVRKIMGQLQKTAPALYEALVTERDAYMAAGLNGLNDYDAIVAVMGIAHVDGVEANLKLNGWKAMKTSCPVA